MRGVVAAGHPVTAQAGADVLRAGGNAVDAAVARVLMSCVTESPLTGPGAGGFMLVHTAGGEDHLLDFFVAAPGRGLADPDPAELTPIDVHFSEDAVQRFNVGPSSCGAYGNPLGLAQALERFGSRGLGELTAGPAAAAREGVEVVRMQAFLFEILAPIFRSTPECAELYAPGGELLREGDTLPLPELGDLLERLGAEGPGFLYSGDVAGACSEWVLERGGLLTREDLAAYEVVEREPARVTYRGREVLTNPPPSSGGILIADALGILERLERPHGPDVIAEVIASTNRARDEEFLAGLGQEGYLERFLRKDALDNVATEVRVAARQHDPHLRDGRRRRLRVGHLLERLVLGRGRARHRDAPQQHARRAGPQPARVPPPRAGGARAEHDGADGGAARRPARGRARLRRVEPDPLGDPADAVGGGRPRAARRSRRGAPAHPRRGRPRRTPSRAWTRTRSRSSSRAAGRCGAGPSRTSSSAASKPWRATRRRAS